MQPPCAAAACHATLPSMPTEAIAALDAHGTSVWTSLRSLDVPPCDALQLLRTHHATIAAALASPRDDWPAVLRSGGVECATVAVDGNGAVDNYRLADQLQQPTRATGAAISWFQCECERLVAQLLAHPPPPQSENGSSSVDHTEDPLSAATPAAPAGMPTRQRTSPALTVAAWVLWTARALEAPQPESVVRIALQQLAHTRGLPVSAVERERLRTLLPTTRRKYSAALLRRLAREVRRDPRLSIRRLQRLMVERHGAPPCSFFTMRAMLQHLGFASQQASRWVAAGDDTTATATRTGTSP